MDLFVSYHGDGVVLDAAESRADLQESCECGHVAVALWWDLDADLANAVLDYVDGNAGKRSGKVWRDGYEVANALRDSDSFGQHRGTTFKRDRTPTASADIPALHATGVGV